MKNIIVNDKEYKLIENIKDAFIKEETESKMTEYFDDYDYILGDWSYGKLRLKGFCKKDNKKLNKINDFENKENYIKNNCAYECKYFVLEKVGSK